MGTYTFPFEHVQDAFETVSKCRDGVIKASVAL
jgi:hypothetical protein